MIICEGNAENGEGWGVGKLLWLKTLLLGNTGGEGCESPEKSVLL